ncbi:allophanate hydrolase subunit 2-domain-containing protein [Lentinula detonsa]|uniref:Allophanate hydrolase subunit 2-domain-containing protein n=1 Tax=Lentinula detonsa TaxID=2804962 RepID=A0AA38Q5D8_9AGAR|nr:allophanate hydrolase subunit 2-domain-containing protein [Lentinula detonsa]
MYTGEKLLIANRGEIAEIGLATLTIYTPSDALASHAILADEAVALPLTSGQSEFRAYCDSANHSVTLLHPGYGFLSENEEFARMVLDNGITWLGPSPDAIGTMGIKHQARQIAEKAGIPIVPGSRGLVMDKEEAIVIAHQATAGGGGMGLVVCHDEPGLAQAFSHTSQYAKTLFHDSGLFIEHYFPVAHHIEVQIFGDGRGDVVHMGERECSIQRRHQKIIEESPSPFSLINDAMKLGQLIQYGSAGKLVIVVICHKIYSIKLGTVEFIVDDISTKHYFLEMNTRVQVMFGLNHIKEVLPVILHLMQVEHPVTEAIHDIDIILMMIDFGLAQKQSEMFPLQQQRFLSNAQHVVEARIYSENPHDSFKPCSGVLQHVDLRYGNHVPPWLRVDHWISTGTVLTQHFDPLLCKLIVTGSSRTEALDRMTKVLASVQIQGPPNNLDYLSQIISSVDFQEGKTTTDFLKNFAYIPHAFTVLSPGLETTVQDLPGRLIGLGVPVSGPMDPLAFRLANVLAGNAQEVEALESVIIAGMDLALHFHVKAIIAVTGKEVIVEVNDIAHDMWAAIEVPQNAILRLRNKKDTSTGFRNYLAIRGGFPQIPKYLGSKATSIKFGGYQDRQLMMCDHLAIGSTNTSTLALPRRLPQDMIPIYPKQWQIYVLNGPHNDQEFVTSAEKIFSITWTVSGTSNRQGIRLESSEKISWTRANGGDGGSHPSNILDNGYALGTVNINGDTPVILTNEGPDMGGYVCLCTVVMGNLWKLGQLSAGDTIKFVPTTWDDARKIRNIWEDWINNVESSLSSHCVPKVLTAFTPEHNVWDLDPKLFTIFPTSTWSHKPGFDFRQAGDSAILVECGPMHVDLTMRAYIHSFELEVMKKGLTGIERFSPCIRSTMCHFNPKQITQKDLLSILIEATHALPNSVTDLNFPGQHFTFPVVLNDRWCHDAILQYMKTTRNKAIYLPSNVDYLAQNNGLGSAQIALQRIVQSDHLVLGVGFYLACPFTVPLDPRCRLVGQKMNPSRTYTPRGAVGLAGLVSAIYPIESPGGYQLYGRTLPAWQTWGRGSNFSMDRPWLLQPFDQIHFEVVTEEEYTKLEQSFDAGQYSFKMENCTFSMKEYAAFIKSVEAETILFRNKQAEAVLQQEQKEKVLLEEWIGEQRKYSTRSELNEIVSVSLAAPLSAMIWKVLVNPGAIIQHEDEILFILEAMKTQIPVKAGKQHVGHVIRALGKGIREGVQVNLGNDLLFLE